MNDKNKIIVLPFLKRTKIENAVNPWNVAVQNMENHLPSNDSQNEGDNVLDELNNIISNIHGESQRIEMYTQNYEVPDKQLMQKSTISMKQNCLKLTKALNNMIDLKKIQDKQFCLYLNRFNIVEIVDDLVINVSKIIKNKKVIFDTVIEEKYMSCDVSKFQKSILILLSNAVKYSSEEEIFVDLDIVEDNVNIAISFKNRNSNLLNVFIDKMDNPEPDFFKDMSIDLYICKEIIKLHEGHIDVLGDQEEICFSIHLPSEKTDSICYLFNDKITNNENLIEQIQIEFSDLPEV